jgi:hypothetical protein
MDLATLLGDFLTNSSGHPDLETNSNQPHLFHTHLQVHKPAKLPIHSFNFLLKNLELVRFE